MKILNLQVQNIKKIKAVNITPTDGAVVISGKNGNGKSSTIDSIAMALGGKKLLPERPVRDGEEKASITVDLGDYIVTRHWTNPTTSYLKVETKDGAKLSNGQNVLNGLVGDLTFDPLAFSTMEPSKRLAVLKDLLKLDFTALDDEFKTVFEKRRDVNRDGKTLSTRMETEFKDVPASLPENEVNIEALKKLKDQAQCTNNQITASRNEIDSLKRENQRLQDEISERQAKIQANNNELLVQEAASNRVLVDVGELDEKIEMYYSRKAVYDKIEDKKKLATALTGLQNTWKELDDRLKEIEEAKKKMLEDSNMPIQGLAFGDKEVLFNEIPFSQLSSAEQIKVSMSIAIAMNPKLRVAMIYNGSLLDKEAMEYIQMIAKEKDMQIWIEKVADGPDGNSIYIEEGKLGYSF